MTLKARLYPLLLSITVLMTTLACNRTDEIYVSPAGDDRNDGSRNQPLQTLHQAVETVRQILGNGQQRDIIIWLDEGTYRIDRPIELGPHDSGQDRFTIQYKALPDTRPVLSGGVEITGWSRSAEGLWVADLPPGLLPDSTFRELFVDGVRGVRARYPETGYLRIDRATDDRRSGFTFHPGDFPLPERPDQVELVFVHDWSISRMPVESIDAEKHLLLSQYPIGTLLLDFFTIDNWEPHPRYYLENDPAFLRSPGQWYFDDRQQRLYLILEDDQDPNEIEVIVPAVGPHLLRIRGDAGNPVRNLSFQDITFEHTSWLLPEQGYPGIQAAHYDPRRENDFWDAVPAAIYVTYGEQVHLSRLTMRHLGGSGIWIGKGTSHCSVTDSYFNDISANGIMSGDGRNRLAEDESWQDDYPDHTSYHTTITGNTVTRVGRQFYGAVGIWAGITADTRIKHNHINELPYTGISIGWEWTETPTPAHDNRINGNHIHDVMQTLSDGGGIYALGLQPNSTISGNLIHRVSAAQGRAPSNGMFIDQGASDFLISENIIYATEQAPFRFHRAGPNLIAGNTVLLEEGISIATFHNTPVENIQFRDNLELQAGRAEDQQLLEEMIEQWKHQRNIR